MLSLETQVLLNQEANKDNTTKIRNFSTKIENIQIKTSKKVSETNKLTIKKAGINFYKTTEQQNRNCSPKKNILTDFLCFIFLK